MQVTNDAIWAAIMTAIAGISVAIIGVRADRKKHLRDLKESETLRLDAERKLESQKQLDMEKASLAVLTTQGKGWSELIDALREENRLLREENKLLREKNWLLEQQLLELPKVSGELKAALMRIAQLESRICHCQDEDERKDSA